MIYTLRTVQGTDHRSVGPTGIEACSLPTQGVGDAKGPLGGNQAALNDRFSHVDWPGDESTLTVLLYVGAVGQAHGTGVWVELTEFLK